MSDSLTSRQIQILKSLIDEYIETAEPVGSEALDKKYNLGVSPATIRNEMSTLTETNFLKQPHTSSGRVPTPKAMKLYIDQLMVEKQMSLAEEVKAKEDVWDARGDVDSLLGEATHVLADYTKSMAIATVSDSDKIWHAGYANIFSNPEFADMEVCESLFSLIDEVESLNDIFFKRFSPTSPLDVLFGEDLDWPKLTPVGIAATHFDIYGKKGALGIIGPARSSYPRIIPVLRYFGNLISDIAR
jgi:transcriptional regulator of heat shock response